MYFELNLTIHMTLSTAWHAADFVPTPYELKHDLDSQYFPYL